MSGTPVEYTSDEIQKRADFVLLWNAGDGASFAAANPGFDEASEQDKIALLRSWGPFDTWKRWIDDGIQDVRDHLRAMMLVDFAMDWWFGPNGPGGVL